MSEENEVSHLAIFDEENQAGRVGWRIGDLTNYSDPFSCVTKLIDYYHTNPLPIDAKAGQLYVKLSNQKDR